MTVTKAHITRQASDHEVPSKTVERDYVLAHVVAAVAATDEHGALVFKGGTSLRLLHFEDYRYSADLDYSVISGDLAAARDLIRRCRGSRRPRRRSPPSPSRTTLLPGSPTSDRSAGGRRP